jgi:hypothetical protein
MDTLDGRVQLSSHLSNRRSNVIPNEKAFLRHPIDLDSFLVMGGGYSENGDEQVFCSSEWHVAVVCRVPR